MFELENGHGSQKPKGKDNVELKFGVIQTDLTVKEFKGDMDFSYDTPKPIMWRH